jgi:hypothetical protein
MRTAPVWCGRFRLERRQHGRKGGLLLGSWTRKLDAAFVGAPPRSLHHPLGAQEPGPHDPCGEPEVPEFGREVHVPHAPGLQRLPVRNAGAETTEAEDVHEVMLGLAPAKILWDRDP